MGQKVHIKERKGVMQRSAYCGKDAERFLDLRSGLYIDPYVKGKDNIKYMLSKKKSLTQSQG